MSEISLDVESKFAKALLKIRKIRPFYSSIYEMLDKIEDDSIETMGVSTKKLIYSRKFVEKQEFRELIFVDLHEIAHIALMHTSRAEGKNMLLFNIACDLYVNKLLSEEFNITPHKESIDIKMPSDVLYCDSVDLNRDCAEDIYNSLKKQAEEQGFFDKNTTAYITYIGSAFSNTEYKEFSISIKRDDNNCDIIEGASLSTGNIAEPDDNTELDRQYNKQIIAEAITKAEMQSIGNEGGKSLLQVQAERNIKSSIDWRKLLLKYCIAASSKDSSFNVPDKRMYYQRAIYPGQVTDISNTLKGVKVCFDVSGSISYDDIARFYGQVQLILKRFKVNAEVIYWDTEVQKHTKLIGLEQLDSIEFKGRGGTDPSCIFEYFDSKDCKIKPIVTLIFTDGYIIEPNVNAWKKRYKNTIWVITKYGDKDFKPIFGTKAYDKDW